MATRYSKRQLDGTTEHYDSREEMEAANPEISTRQLISEISNSFNPFFAILGFVVSGISAVFTLSFFSEFSSLATWIKFFIAAGMAVLVGYISGKFGNILFILTIALLILGATGGIIALIWIILSI